MPITKSAKKALRVSRRRRARNLQIKVNFKTLIKKFTKGGKKTTFSQVQSAIDKAAKRRVIHRRKAARLKSRLARKKNA